MWAAVAGGAWDYCSNMSILITSNSLVIPSCAANVLNALGHDPPQSHHTNQWSSQTKPQQMDLKYQSRQSINDVKTILVDACFWSLVCRKQRHLAKFMFCVKTLEPTSVAPRPWELLRLDMLARMSQSSETLCCPGLGSPNHALAMAIRKAHAKCLPTCPNDLTYSGKSKC